MNNNQQQFIVCNVCQGRGVVQDKSCPQCHGVAVVLPFYGKFLFWGKRINTVNIAVDRVLKIIDKTIDLVLMLWGFVGLIVLIYFAYKNDFQTIFTLNYWQTPSTEKAVFWFSALTDIYLYYRLQRKFGYKNNVLPKIFFKKELIPSQIDWHFITSQPKRNLIDVSLAFDEQAHLMIEKAWSLSKDFSHPQTQRIHLAAVFPMFDQGAIIFGRLGLDINKYKDKIGRVLSWNIEGKSRQTFISNEIYKILLNAYAVAYHEKRSKVQITDIALGLVEESLTDKELEDKDYLLQIFIDLDLDYQKVRNVIQWIRIQRQLKQGLSRFRSSARYRSKSGLDKAMTAVVTPYLDQFSVDLTKAAKAGQLFPCIGRQKELEEIYRIIEGSRDGVLLVGHQGVGRTAILYGLAQQMVAEEVPKALQEKRLVSISLSRLVSGGTPAEIEDRILGLANDVIKARNIVLVIEDLHSLYGITAGSETSLSLSDVLAELINKKLFLLIATTSQEAYSKVIQGSSLEGNFQTVKIAELAFDDAIQVLEAKSGPIEYKNNVFFSYSSIEATAKLSQRFIQDRYLPEKALDLMEEVAVKVRKEKGDRAIITVEDVATIISEKTGIKANKITQKESEKLLNLEDEIHKRVIGQDEAVKMVSSSLRRARAELRDAKRPISNLLFLGPTGVGKTELAKTVADVYFGDEEDMLRFDMSEYQDKSSVNTLLGTAQEPGTLTEAVKKQPFSIVLFDEIEKAHPDILNLFLQVMDDGRLTDGKGRTIDFTNTIVVMTSNAGAQIIQDEINNNTSIEKIKEILLNEKLKENFKPEFLNRFDGIIVFKPLTMADVIKIAKIMARKVEERLAQKNIELIISEEAIAELAELGYDPKFGARPLRRVIQEKVDDTIATYLLKGDLDKRDKVIMKPGGVLEITKGVEI